jgi:flagellar hook-associated protein 2
MTAISSPTYDPPSTATALAQKTTSAAQAMLDAQTSAAGATAKGLSTLGTAISMFQASLASLTGLNRTMVASSATFSDTTLGSATATSSAAAGSYTFFVKQVATASQVSYAGLKDDVGIGGQLVLNLGGGTGGSIKVDLAAANTDGGALSIREIAAAINASSDNSSLVTASVVTTGTTSELVLSAKNTGANSTITLDTSGMTFAAAPADATTSSLIAACADPTRVHQLATGQDAEIHLGSETGTAITQASNTFTNVTGVTMTFTHAQAAGAAPITLTVGTDSSKSQSNVQSLLNSFNTLRKMLDGLVDPGDPNSGQPPGVFATDSGVRAMRDRLVNLMRPTGSNSLAAYGITAGKDGMMTLDSTAFATKLAADPTGLNTLIGSASITAPKGIAGSLNTYFNSWSNGASGQIQSRTAANTGVQQGLTEKQTQIDNQYNAAYTRYLAQFTALQVLQGQMNYNVSIFDAMFGDKKSS